MGVLRMWFPISFIEEPRLHLIETFSAKFALSSNWTRETLSWKINLQPDKVFRICLRMLGIGEIEMQNPHGVHAYVSEWWEFRSHSALLPAFEKFFETSLNKKVICKPITGVKGHSHTPCFPCSRKKKNSPDQKMWACSFCYQAV